MAKDILVVQVGNNDCPASDEDIKHTTRDMKKLLKNIGDTDTALFVTHNAINMFRLSSLDYSHDNRFESVLHLFEKGIISLEEARKQLGL